MIDAAISAWYSIAMPGAQFIRIQMELSPFLSLGSEVAQWRVGKMTIHLGQGFPDAWRLHVLRFLEA